MLQEYCVSSGSGTGLGLVWILSTTKRAASFFNVNDYCARFVTLHNLKTKCLRRCVSVFCSMLCVVAYISIRKIEAAEKQEKNQL